MCLLHDQAIRRRRLRLWRQIRPLALALSRIRALCAAQSTRGWVLQLHEWPLLARQAGAQTVSRLPVLLMARLHARSHGYAAVIPSRQP